MNQKLCKTILGTTGLMMLMATAGTALAEEENQHRHKKPRHHHEGHRPASCDSFAHMAGQVVGSMRDRVAEAVSCLAASPETAGAAAVACGADAAVQGLVLAWNDIIKNSSAHLGPRDLTYDTLKGTVLGSTERIFYTKIPVPKGTKVRFNKTGHEGHAVVAVCAHSTQDQAAYSRVADWNIAAGAGGFSDEWTYNGEYGDYAFIGVHVAGRSAAKKISYTVQLAE